MGISREAVKNMEIQLATSKKNHEQEISAIEKRLNNPKVSPGKKDKLKFRLSVLRKIIPVQEKRLLRLGFTQ